MVLKVLLSLLNLLYIVVDIFWFYYGHSVYFGSVALIDLE